jgi:hypothetical protein
MRAHKLGRWEDAMSSRDKFTVTSHGERLLEVAEKNSISEKEFAEIPAVKKMNTYLRLLDTLMELHSGELFAVIKLTDIAERFSLKIGRKYSALKTSSMIRRLFGDYVIEKHQSRYFAAINIDNLKKLLKRYEPWRIEGCGE